MISRHVEDYGHRPILLGRFDCPGEKLDEIDAWIPKHLDDSLAHRSISLTIYYTVVADVPAVLSCPAKRAVVYVADDLAGMLDWMDSPELTGAVEDSSERETLFYPLDGESPGTANIYDVHRMTSGSVRDIPAVALVERFEVTSVLESSFDGWLERRCDALGSVPGVVRVRACHAFRGMEDRLPFNRYRSIGNRMTYIEFNPELRAAEVLESGIIEKLSDSQRWDRVLPYVRRELHELLLVRGKETG